MYTMIVTLVVDVKQINSLPVEMDSVFRCTLPLKPSECAIDKYINNVLPTFYFLKDFAFKSSGLHNFD